MMPRFNSDQKPSMVWVWTRRRTYSPRPWRTYWWSKSRVSPRYLLCSSVAIKLTFSDTVRGRNFPCSRCCAAHHRRRGPCRSTAPVTMSLPEPPVPTVFCSNAGSCSSRRCRSHQLHDAHQFAEARIRQCGPDAHAHVMGGFVGAEAHHPVNLQGADTLLAGQDQVDDLEPCVQTDVGVLKHRAGDDREAVTASLGALSALPSERTVGDRRDLRVAAARALDAIGPAAIPEICPASVVIGEQRVETQGRSCAW